jgi:acyl-CoA synthetase (NDP forming)
VIGASKRRGTIGGELFRNVLEGDFQGAAYPVNRDGSAVAGVRGYRSVGEIPDPVDVAVICVPAAGVVEVAEEALAHGVRALVVISAGFAETGSDGIERQERLLALVRAHGARLIGPNCLGISVAGTSLNATFASRSTPPGNIGFSSQSGALGLALLEAAVTRPRPLGVRLDRQQGGRLDERPAGVVGGRRVDRGDPALRRVVREPSAVRAHRAQGARRKPILASRAVARRAASGRRARTRRRLAGLRRSAADALFRQAGVIRAETLEELVDVASLFSRAGGSTGRSVGIVTNAGGLGILCADACEAAGLELPALGDEDAVAASARGASRGGERREPRRHARRRDRRDLRGRDPARPRRPARRRVRRALRARRQRDGRRGRAAVVDASEAPSPTSPCSR